MEETRLRPRLELLEGKLSASCPESRSAKHLSRNLDFKAQVQKNMKECRGSLLGT